MDFLPNNKYQLIGFIVWVVCQDVVALLIGKNKKTDASSILEACFLALSAAVVAVLAYFKGEKK